MKAIFQRRSIRKYSDARVERSKIIQILKAAMAAPSAANQQPWEFYVVRDRQALKQLAEISPYTGCTVGADVAIVSVYRENCILPEYAQIDLSIAMENLWLEATSLGLGGVWLGIAPHEDNMKKVEEILNIPKGLRAFALFPLGYPGEQRKPEDRFDAGRIHFVEEAEM